MGLEPALARSAVRISIGWSTTERDVAAFAGAWAHVTAQVAANATARRRAVA
jgi:cysteine sulfinate desulfinase/cysteine desulfurase-like protein